MKVLTKERAIQIAKWFHTGQWSALYLFADTGNISKNYESDYIGEVDKLLNDHPWSRKDRQLLTSLKNYFNNVIGNTLTI